MKCIARIVTNKRISNGRENISRDGIEDLLAWIETTDFYYAPASTRFHGNHEGGLLEHSLNVYDALKDLVKQFPEIAVSEETIAISALFHDLCKANYYAVGTKNVKDEATGQWHKEPFYKAEDQFLLDMVKSLSLFFFVT